MTQPIDNITTIGDLATWLQATKVVLTARYVPRDGWIVVAYDPGDVGVVTVTDHRTLSYAITDTIARVMTRARGRFEGKIDET